MFAFPTEPNCMERPFSLFRLSTGSNYLVSSRSVAVQVEPSQLSRAFNWFIVHSVDNFTHLVDPENLYTVAHGFDASARKIQQKMAHYGLVFPGDQRSCVAGFIDCTLVKIERPSGPSYIQRAFYTKFKKMHAIKFQGVVLANGLIVDVFGPRSGRRNDLHLLGASNINQKMQNAQAGNQQQFVLYGDNIYVVRSHIRRPHRDLHLTPLQALQNQVMTKMRIAIEWAFNKVKTLWKYVKTLRLCRVGSKGIRIGQVFQVCVLLTNMHSCLSENLTASYFDHQCPSLATYMNPVDNAV